METFLRLERCLLPPPETVRWDNGKLAIETYSTIEKVSYCAKNFFTFGVLLLVSPLTLAYDWLTTKKVTSTPKPAPDIAPDAPQWPPAQRGFATSLFQTAGLGTKWSATPGLAGRCDWDKWMDKEGHIIHPKGFDKNEFFTDILSDPTAYIQMLKDQNVTAHRSSLEWAVIQPNKGGPFDLRAVALYRNFIDKLIEAEITPSVTLCHFVLPEWFYESGSFQKMDNIDAYVDFALRAMETFPQVTSWWSFNELGVKAFQQTREVYPTDLPEGAWLPSRVHAAGISTRNMLIAHCKLHKAVAEQHPDKKVGVTHQWLKFDTATGNWLERTIAYIFTKFGFTPVYQFFKGGKFSFEFPFMANVQFEVPKEQFDESGHFLMQLGVQAYPKPMVKMGLNHGQTYPGVPGAINNLPFFTFGSTCEPGGNVMRFGPRHKASGIDECLDDAFDLTDNVYITEYGSDAMLQKWGAAGFERDDALQAHYLQQLTERIRDYCANTFRQLKGIFAWSDLRRQMEWENGFECELATIETHVDENRRMTGYESTPASNYLKGVYAAEEGDGQEVG
jgi:beta-glucosidase/6-phospho-beta-glucosidase/beta-galactosidase